MCTGVEGLARPRTVAQERLAGVADARSAAARANTGVPPAWTVTDFLTQSRTPSGDWLAVIGGPLLTQGGELTQTAQDLLDESRGPEAEAEVVQALVRKAREVFRKDLTGDRDEKYRDFRRFLIDHPTATIDEAISALRRVGLVPTDLFEDIPPSCRAGTVSYPCRRCCWPMRLTADIVQCESDRCQHAGARFQRTHRGLIALGKMKRPSPIEVKDLLRLRRGAWRYTLQPGLIELELAAALRELGGVDVALWPALDSYDLHVVAGENEWRVDVKDWESTWYLAKHLERQKRRERQVIVVPEWRSRQPEILQQWNSDPNLDFMTFNEFVNVVRDRATPKGRHMRKRDKSKDRGKPDPSLEPLMQLAVDAALALVVRYLPAPCRLGDAILFTNGRLRLWDQWKEQPLADKKRIAKFMRFRPEALADRKVFLDQARKTLEQRLRFGHAAGEPQDVFEHTSGKDIAVLLEELLGEIEAGCSRSRVPSFPLAQGGATKLEFRYRDIGFGVPSGMCRVSPPRKTLGRN